MKLPSRKLLDFMIMVLHSQTILTIQLKYIFPKKKIQSKKMIKHDKAVGHAN